MFRKNLILCLWSIVLTLIICTYVQAQPDLCDGPIYANPFDTTNFRISQRACVTFTWYYDPCATNPPSCCDPQSQDYPCRNDIGYGVLPGPTYYIDSWTGCGLRSDSSSICLAAGTYYFKAQVSSVYNCPNTYVTISADCSAPHPCCQ